MVYCHDASCKTVHSLKVRDPEMGTFLGGNARIWKLAFKHPQIYNPAYYEVLEHETLTHSCKVALTSFHKLNLCKQPLANELDFLDFPQKQEAPSSKALKEITNDKHVREETDKEAETEENVDESTELPAKRARTSEHSETLPLADVKTESSS